MSYTYSNGNIVLARLLEIIVSGIYDFFSFFIKDHNKGLDVIDKILIVEPFQMGDVIALSILIGPLKKRFPKSSLFVLTQKKNKDIFQFDDRINVITSEFPWSDYKKKFNFKRYFRLLKDLIIYRTLRINIGIDPRGDINLK